MIAPRHRDDGGTDAVAQGAVPTITIEETIVGPEPPAFDDPTELYHEASRFYPGVIDPTVHGTALLEHSSEMRASVARSTKRHPTARNVELPAAELPGLSLGGAIAHRRSRPPARPGRIDLPQLATLLGAAYGISAGANTSAQAFRTVPSAGALYPLELYVLAPAVLDLDPDVFHYDPLRHALEQLRPLSPGPELETLAAVPEVLRDAAAVVVMTAMFWRSRFKYGARAYRFTLLEAGHIGQNLALAATALGLAAIPIGGFYDRRVDDLVGADGLNEASIYLFAFSR